MEVVCVYCLDEYRKGERPDVGRLYLECEMGDGSKTLGTHQIWSYERPPADIVEERRPGISHGMCPLHYKREMIKIDQDM